MDLDLLRVELERSFEPAELQELARDALGLEPDQIVANATKATLARALVTRCASEQALEALCDAVAAVRDDVHPRMARPAVVGFPNGPEPGEGAELGPYRLDAKLGEGPRGTVYRATDQAGEVRLKILRPEATVDVRALRRFFTHNRLVARLSHAGLPWWLTVGEADGRSFIAHQWVDGETLAEYLKRSGPLSLSDARPMLTALLESMAELHSHRLVHGALHAGNVLLVASSRDLSSVVLLDAGSDRLRLTSPVSLPQPDRLSALAPAAVIAPEQLLGGKVDARADVYAFGVLLYQIMAGTAPFAEGSASEAILGHLTREPTPLSQLAPRGWVSDKLDALVLDLLSKDPRQRPQDAFDVLQALEAVPLRAPRPSSLITEEDLDQRIQEFLHFPDEKAAARLEAAIDDGAGPERIAETLVFAADQYVHSRDPRAQALRRTLLMRAVRLYEITLRDFASAEGLIRGLLDDDPRDVAAGAILARLQRAQGKHEELIESLLERSQSVPPGPDRADVLTELAKVCAKDLEDRSQALVAYASAFCEDPTRAALAREIERLAADSQDAWEEVLGSCNGALAGALEAAHKRALLVQVGRWYAGPVGRPDLATPVFQAVLEEDPRSPEALEGLAQIYRSTQQWMELGMVLTAFADVAPNPAQARDLRVEAGDLLLYKLEQPGHARALYERVLAEDPSHERAASSLARVFELAGDARQYAETLEQRALALSGDERHAALCRAARAFEEQLKDPEAAARRYELVLSENPRYPDGLRGLDRCLAGLKRYPRLLEVLRTELELAETARERVELFARVADLHEHEFLDHEQALEARENVLDLEPTNDAALTGLARDLRALKRWSDLAVVYERHMDVVSDRHRRVALGLQMGELFASHLKLPERAIEAYESVLKVEPGNEMALDAVIELWAEQGEVERALEAIDALVSEAATPADRAKEQLRAAKLLEAAGDEDAAMDRYKAAVDADPADKSLLVALRQAYVRRGRFQVAVDLLERELELADGAAAKGRICGELARMYHDGLHQDLRAEAFAKRALEHDPGNVSATLVLGDIAFADEQYLTASKHYTSVLAGTPVFERDEVVRIHLCCMEALEKSDQPARALAIGESALTLVPDDVEVVRRIAELCFEHGTASRAHELSRELLTRFDAELGTLDRAAAAYRAGETARRLGFVQQAEHWLGLAIELDPGATPPWRALIDLREEAGHTQSAYELMERLLDLLVGEERVELLIRMGDLAAAALGDTNLAARHYLRALGERRDDRKVLMKLMQLYSEEKDWRKLTKVILKISELVEEPRQKAKYLHTSAMIASRELGDPGQALELLQEALQHDPTFDDARVEALRQSRRVGDFEAVKSLLKDRIKYAVEGGDTPNALLAMDELGQVYLEHFRRHDQAVAVAESALELAPDDLQRRAHLAALYAAQPGTYFDRAVVAYDALLQKVPFDAETYRALRRLYTDTKWGDATWCCCQALHALGQATAEETSFYARMRNRQAAVIKARIEEDAWAAHLTHADVNPLLTVLFTVIQSSVAAVRARPAAKLGYGAEHRIDPGRDPLVVAQTIRYSAGVLGVEEPPLYQNPNDAGLLSFLHATTPSLVLGRAALSQRGPDQKSLFQSGRQLTYFRPGFYVRHLIPTGTELKAWLFATLALVSSKIKVPQDLEAMASEARQALERGLSEEPRRYLSREVVPRLLDGGALDLKRWVAGIDVTADRVGLVMSNDLGTAVSEIQTAPEVAGSPPVNDRLEQLFRYAVSAQFLSLRRQLGTAVDL